MIVWKYSRVLNRTSRAFIHFSMEYPCCDSNFLAKLSDFSKHINSLQSTSWCLDIPKYSYPDQCFVSISWEEDETVPRPLILWGCIWQKRAKHLPSNMLVTFLNWIIVALIWIILHMLMLAKYPMFDVPVSSSFKIIRYFLYGLMLAMQNVGRKCPRTVHIVTPHFWTLRQSIRIAVVFTRHG